MIPAGTGVGESRPMNAIVEAKANELKALREERNHKEEDHVFMGYVPSTDRMTSEIVKEIIENDELADEDNSSSEVVE